MFKGGYCALFFLRRGILLVMVKANPNTLIRLPQKQRHPPSPTRKNMLREKEY